MILFKFVFNHQFVLLFLFQIVILQTSSAQYINTEQLIAASIKYHDPDSKWKTFNDTLIVEMTSPKQTPRISKVFINNFNNEFYLKIEQDDHTSTYILKSGKCDLKLNGSSIFSEIETKKFNLTCERGTMLKNYYTYLYGMPMKIMAPGAIISNKVEKKSFQGKDYLSIKVSYSPEIGSDVWFFYFNPSSYALEGYQFFKTDSNGSLITTSGEYILFEGQAVINNIKIPKIRKWYYNKNDKYLGTDTLTN